MKKLHFLTLLMFCNVLKAQVSVTSQHPELNILYRDYNNIVIPYAEGADENNLIAEGAQISALIYQGKKGFIVRPDNDKRIINLIHQAYKNGVWVHLDTVVYISKTFPTPSVRNTEISKLSGANIRVGYDNSAPLQHQFEILNLVIHSGDHRDIVINGPIILPEHLKRLKRWSTYPVSIKARNLFNGLDIEIFSSFIIAQ